MTTLDDWVIAAAEALDAAGLGAAAEVMLEHGGRGCDNAEAALIERAKVESPIQLDGVPLGGVVLVSFTWDAPGLLALGRVCTVRREVARAEAAAAA